MQGKFFASFAVCFFLLTIPTSAQDFQLMCYDENYENLKDSVHNFYNALKFSPISKNKKIYVSFGGEARLEYVSMLNEGWGKINTGHNNFLLLPLFLLHIKSNFSLFKNVCSNHNNI